MGNSHTKFVPTKDTKYPWNFHESIQNLLVVEPTPLKNMLVKLDPFPR